MSGIKELPPGTLSVFCTHFDPSSVFNQDDHSNDGVVSLSCLVYLKEIPSEIGYHGTCPFCETRYFSRTKGAF